MTPKWNTVNGKPPQKPIRFDGVKAKINDEWPDIEAWMVAGKNKPPQQVFTSYD